MLILVTSWDSLHKQWVTNLFDPENNHQGNEDSLFTAATAFADMWPDAIYTLVNVAF